MDSTAPMKADAGSQVMFAPRHRPVQGGPAGGRGGPTGVEEPISLARLSDLVHDLRTPLASLRLTLQLLREALGDDPWAGARLRQAERSVFWLDSLVGNLLSVAAADEAGQPHPLVAVSVRESAEAALAAAAPLFESVGQQVRLTCPTPSPAVWGESLLVQRVLLNLLSNAAKYGGSGQTVALDIAAAGCWVEVRVTDHGAGIPEQEQAAIFERFVRGSARGSAASGAGLGLTVSRAIVEQLGGAIGVDSAVGRGASFWFTLPAVV